MMWPLTSEQLAGMIRDAMWRDPEYLKTIQYLKRAHVTWQPRPDRVDDGDLQTSAWESKADGVCIILGGNGSGTTETAVAKACKSILDTPAPRPDTPFWFLANSLEMSMGVIWKEKIWGHGHIPVEMIDHERISWHKGKQNWPYRVPLKPDKDGNNWELVFRSYEQGRAALQAESIGGFLFSEQFPWSLLEEVVRGCRESGHSNPGTQYVEFTPVDPALSIEIEEMLENGHEPEEGADPDRYYLPEGLGDIHPQHSLRDGGGARLEKVVRTVLRDGLQGTARDQNEGAFPGLQGADLQRSSAIVCGGRLCVGLPGATGRQDVSVHRLGAGPGE